jgi:hypothetical protein
MPVYFSLFVLRENRVSEGDNGLTDFNQHGISKMTDFNQLDVRKLTDFNQCVMV